MRKNILLLIFSMMLGACSGGQLRLQSNPVGADVFLQRSENDKMKIGVTPLDIKVEQYPDLASKNAVSLVVEKEGFLSQSIILTDLSAQSLTNISVALKTAPELPQVCKDAEYSASELAYNIAQAQYLLMRKNLTEAEILLGQLNLRYPKISVIYDLLGNLSYLKRDTARALQYYKASLAIKQDNIETQRMVKKLEPMNPSSTKPGMQE